MDDVACFQHRQPGARGVVRNAGIAAKGRQIDLLRSTPGTQFEESEKEPQVSDLEHLVHVALDISGGVVRQPLVGRDIAVVNPRIRPLPENRKQVGGGVRGRTQFLYAGREQHENAVATGQ